MLFEKILPVIVHPHVRATELWINPRFISSIIFPPQKGLVVEAEQLEVRLLSRPAFSEKGPEKLARFSLADEYDYAGEKTYRPTKKIIAVNSVAVVAIQSHLGATILYLKPQEEVLILSLVHGHLVASLEDQGFTNQSSPKKIAESLGIELADMGS